MHTVTAPSNIRLGQFLKFADLVESGAAVKALLADNMVLVNDEVETRRGRQLADGDLISIGDQQVRLRLAETTSTEESP